MRIAVDIDGTLTDFGSFVLENSKYIEKKYNLTIKNINGYDIDEVFDLKNHFLSLGLSEEQAEIETKKIVNNFWNKYYLKYVLTSFRTNVKETLNKLIEDGHEIIITSSRKKTCDKDLIGFLVKYSTILKFKLNGIKYSKIVFFPDDAEKIEYIKNNNIDISIDDKPEVIGAINDTVKCICVASAYNEKVEPSDGLRRTSFFDIHSQFSVYQSIKRFEICKSVKNLKIYPNLKQTERTYKLMKTLSAPVISQMFQPIVINSENISKEKPLIYAPNHRKTLDPFFITMSSDDAIHWAALKRFFTGEDSIFNNSKNPFLCYLTSKLFKDMGMIPIDRGNDNSESIEMLNYCLKNKSCIGIFPEGTTNKNPSIQELLEIKSGILHFAKDNDALIQPIAIVWFPKNAQVKNRVVINYQQPFSMEHLTIEEGRQKWIDLVLNGIKENQKVIDDMIVPQEQPEDKVLKLK